MTLTGHIGVGMATGLLVGALYPVPVNQEPLAWLALLVPVAMAGAVAPDRLEWAGELGFRWLPHRTLTHWWPLWVLPPAALLPGGDLPAMVEAAMLAFFAGGISHLLADLPNPSGIPGWLPGRTVSLNWWRSGQNEWWLVPLTWVAPALLWLPEIMNLVSAHRP